MRPSADETDRATRTIYTLFRVTIQWQSPLLSQGSRGRTGGALSLLAPGRAARLRARAEGGDDGIKRVGVQ